MGPRDVRSLQATSPKAGKKGRVFRLLERPSLKEFRALRYPVEQLKEKSSKARVAKRLVVRESETVKRRSVESRRSVVQFQVAAKDKSDKSG